MNSKNEEKTVIEINGVKMEIDLRHAKQVNHFKIGDPVKLLLVEQNDVKSGIIVEFEEFESMPTIVVAYLMTDYWTTGITFAHINSKSADKYEMIPAHADTMLTVDKATIVSKMNDEITKKEQEVLEAKRKKKYFLEQFGVYFAKEEALT